MAKKRKKSSVRVIPFRRKIIKPKPDCPRCKRGILMLREYVEVATEDRDEQRTAVPYCPKCEWIF